MVETLEAQAKWTQWKSKEEMWEMRRAARKAARLEATRKIQSKVELVSPSPPPPLLSLSLSLSLCTRALVQLLQPLSIALSFNILVA